MHISILCSCKNQQMISIEIFHYTTYLYFFKLPEQGRVVLLVWHKNDHYKKSTPTFILWNPIVGNFWKFDLTKYHLAMLTYKWKKSLTFFTPCYIKRKIIHYDIRSSQKSSVLMLIHVCTFRKHSLKISAGENGKFLKRFLRLVKKTVANKKLQHRGWF